jgi:hypothetical protein
MDLVEIVRRDDEPLAAPLHHNAANLIELLPAR